MSETRKIAAILAADVVGFSRDSVPDFSSQLPVAFCHRSCIPEDQGTVAANRNRMPPLACIDAELPQLPGPCLRSR